MPAPSTAVPSHNHAPPGTERNATPAARPTSAAPISRSAPMRRANGCTSGDAAANASSGSALSRPSRVSESPVSSPMRPSNGPTEVIDERRQAAARKTAISPRAPRAGDPASDTG